MILGKNGTGNNGTNEKVGKNGTQMLNYFKPLPQTPILKCAKFTYFAIFTCVIFTGHWFTYNNNKSQISYM